MTEVAAGWYPDPTLPAGSAGLRYWDGQGWTEHVAAPQQPAWTPEPGPTTPDGVPLAGWGWRLLAYLIDGVLCYVVTFLAGLPYRDEVNVRATALGEQLARDGDFGSYWAGTLDLSRDQLGHQWWVVVALFAYYVLMLRWKQATIGKLVVGLRVRLRERPELPWSAVWSRVLSFNGLGALASLGFLTGSVPLMVLGALLLFVYLPIDGLWPLWDKNRQALHDKVARTNVVKVR